MQLTVNMEHAEDLAALAILAQALNVARYDRTGVESFDQKRIHECLTGAIQADKLLEHFRSRRKFFEAAE